MKSKLKPYFVTQIDAPASINMPWAAHDMPVKDLRFYTFARDVQQLYKDAHAFLFDQWVKKQHQPEQEDFHPDDCIDPTDMQIIHRACEPRFAVFEVIEDEEEIRILELAQRNLESLQALPHNHELREYIPSLVREIHQRLSANNKDMSRLRSQNAAIEMGFVRYAR